MRAWSLTLALWLAVARSRPQLNGRFGRFIGFTFGGETTFVDPEKAIGTKNAVVGVSGGWLGEIFGLEADLGRAPGFFQTDATTANAGLADLRLVSSAVTTLTGNVVIALPARMAG